MMLKTFDQAEYNLRFRRFEEARNQYNYLLNETFPLEGVQGLNFPYRIPRKLLLTQSPGFQSGLDNPIKTQSEFPE